MQANYKNWMPKGMIAGIFVGVVVLAGIILLINLCVDASAIKTAINVIGGVILFLGVCVTLWSVFLYRAFDYNGKRKLSKQVVEGLAKYTTLPDGGVGLDVGCGSGALTIACAKQNPNAKMVGIDRWGKEYASFNKTLCESNASVEGVEGRTEFKQGDANKLEFQDESFDAVTSNYVYHNILVKDRQKLLLETLRCLKKGGTFAIHDIFTKSNYGDMQSFVQKLENSGYEKVELIDTTNGMFMSHKEAIFLGLSGSAILCGRK